MTPKAGSVQRLVWPAAWQALASRTSVGVVVTLSVTAFLVVLGITADRMVEVAFASVGAVLFAILATYAYLTTLQAQRRSRDHIGVVAAGSNSSTTFMNQLLVIEMAYLAMALTAAALLFLVPSLVDQMPRTGTWNDMRLHSVARYAPVLACYSAALLLSPLVRKRRQLGAGLAPEGVYVWTWFGSCFFAWDWIIELRPSAGRELGVDLVVREPDDRPSNPEENWLGRANFFRRRKSRIQVGYLAANPAVAFYALRFYHRHPELRTELGTDAAAQRIRAGDLEA